MIAATSPWNGFPKSTKSWSMPYWMFDLVPTFSQHESTRISGLENRITSLSTIVVILFWTLSDVIGYHNYIFMSLFLCTCFPSCLKCPGNSVLSLSSIQMLDCWVVSLSISATGASTKVFSTLYLTFFHPFPPFLRNHFSFFSHDSITFVILLLSCISIRYNTWRIFSVWWLRITMKKCALPSQLLNNITSEILYSWHLVGIHVNAFALNRL